MVHGLGNGLKSYENRKFSVWHRQCGKLAAWLTRHCPWTIFSQFHAAQYVKKYDHIILDPTKNAIQPLKKGSGRVDSACLCGGPSGKENHWNHGIKVPFFFRNSFPTSALSVHALLRLSTDNRRFERDNGKENELPSDSGEPRPNEGGPTIRENHGRNDATALNNCHLEPVAQQNATQRRNHGTLVP